MKKAQIIQHLINLYINPNWEGNKANSDRWEMTKQLRKEGKRKLLAMLFTHKNYKP